MTFVNNMATVLITGGTGLIGTALTKELLNKNYDVIILTRFPERYSLNTSRLIYTKWDIEKQTIDKDAISKADYVIHLAGANLGEKRWTEKRKKEIVESRTQSSALLVKALKEDANNVKAVISASAIGWYSSDPDLKQNKDELWKGRKENEPADESFSGQTCRQWEESIEPVSSLGKRLVKLRTGLLLSNEGGVVQRFKKPLRFGFATILGNGKQVMSWIHVDDLVRLYIYAIENEKLQGVYNAVAPHPVTNKTFVLKLARSTRGRFFVPIFVPSFILKIVFGEMSIEVLKSATVSCDKIKINGFHFLYPGIIAAIINLSSQG